MRHLAYAAALAVTAGAASAATYTFDDLGPSANTLTFSSDTGAGPGITAQAFSFGILNGGLPLITQNADGLGVNGRPDSSGGIGVIDGSPVLSGESIRIEFGYAVRLVEFVLGAFDGNDDYNLYINDVLFASGEDLGTNPINVNNVTSFTVEAVGSLFGDGGGLFNPSRNDDFTLARIETAAVPLPAAGFLLLGALGALGIARRRAS